MTNHSSVREVERKNDATMIKRPKTQCPEIERSEIGCAGHTETLSLLAGDQRRQSAVKVQ